MRIAVISYDRTQRASVAKKLVRGVFGDAQVDIISLRDMVKAMWALKKGTKNTYVRSADENVIKRLEIIWAKLGEVYDGFVCLDIALAHYTMPSETRPKATNFDNFSGMINTWLNDTPILYLMDPLLTYSPKYKVEAQAQKALQSVFHIKKLWRRLMQVPSLEKPVKIYIPTNEKELQKCREIALSSTIIAADIETTGLHISCCGFACEHPKLPYTFVFVIPFFMNTPTADEGMFWATDHMFAQADKLMRDVLESPVPKIHQNGTYDLTLYTRYGIMVDNMIWDTQHLLHAMFPSMDKALYNVAALFLDNYRYWKEDAKDASKDKTKEKTYMPTDIKGHLLYWRYNGLDCAYTLEAYMALIRYWKDDGQTVGLPAFAPRLDYVWRNYVREYLVQFGPCFYMSMTGMKASPKIQQQLSLTLSAQAKIKLGELREIVADPTLNPNSPPQLQKLYYDILRMPKDKRKGRTTDKRTMANTANVHPLFSYVINAVNEAKEPANNASKYGSLPLWKGTRLLYNMKASTTVTARLSSSQHNFKVGTNFQNYPKIMRIFAVAEKGEVLCSADYSQSDSYFVAFESQDKVMIETVTNDRDTHSEHVEFFFGYEYSKVVAGDKAKEAWVTHPISGCRQIIKKVTHGTNYDMGGATMLQNVQKPAAIALVTALLGSKHATSFAKSMGATRAVLMQAANLPTAALEKACEYAQSLYYKRYPELARWKKSAVTQAVLDGGRIRMFGGTTTVMLCDPRKNQRFVPAAYGQGGTSGNTNNALIRLYYLNGDMWEEGYRLTLQVHDEIISSLPENNLSLVERKRKIMETPCEIRGRKFTIPVSADISYVWSEKYSVEYNGKDEEVLAEAAIRFNAMQNSLEREAAAAVQNAI